MSLGHTAFQDLTYRCIRCVCGSLRLHVASEVRSCYHLPALEYTQVCAFRIQPSLSAMRELVHVQGGGMFHLMQWCCFVHVSCKPTFHAAKRYFHIISYHFRTLALFAWCLWATSVCWISTLLRHVPYSSNDGSVRNEFFRWWKKSCTTWDVENPSWIVVE